MKKQSIVSDCNALVTGMILALDMPPEIPVWISALSGISAIIVVKQFCGGLGQNLTNPVLAARCFLSISFAGKMTNFSYSGSDGVPGATPLATFKSSQAMGVPAIFMGNTPGIIGEVSVMALLTGATYLLTKKVILIRIPDIYVLTAMVFAVLFEDHGFDLSYIVAHPYSGGLTFGASFMAIDCMISPVIPKGQIVSGILLGVLTRLFRIFGSSAEDMSYAIIISSILVLLIEKATLLRVFEREGKQT